MGSKDTKEFVWKSVRLSFYIFIGLFIIGVIIVCVAMFIQNGYNNLTYVTSKVDDRKYLVRNMKDRQEAADMLAVINQKLEKLKYTKHIDD